MSLQIMDEQTAEYFLAKIRQDNDGQHHDFAIPGYASKPIVGYQSMRQDLILCVDSATRFYDFMSDETMSFCILHTIVILYGKCFTDSDKYPRLNANQCFQNENAKFKPLHEELMELRHNLSAHRGTTEYEIGFPYLKLNINNLSRQVRVLQIKRHKPKEDRIKQYIELFSYLISFVEKRFKDASEKLWDHLFKNFTPEQLAQLKIAGPTNT